MTPLLLLFPQPSGPREHDEVDPGDQMAPPDVPPKPPAATDPLEPPNWDDIANKPWDNTDPVEGPTGMPVPAPPVEMPPGEKYFDVSPPQPTPRFAPTEIPVPDWWTTPVPAPIFQPTPVPTWWETPLEQPEPDIRTDPRPGPAPAPYSPPGIDPVPGPPSAEPDVPVWLEPFRPPAPDPVRPTAPDPFSPPLPDIFGDPIGDPITTPIGDPFVSAPTPRIPAPGPTPAPPLPVDLSTPFQPWEDTTLEPQTRPKPLRAGGCDCTTTKTKKKKKEKSKERDVCYRGTYVQLKKGIAYQRIEEVPCEAKAPKKARAPRRRTPKDLADLARDVFNRPPPPNSFVTPF